MIPLRYFALIPAAGIGARMGAECPKQYLPIAGKPMLRHVLDTFASVQTIAHTFVVVSPDDPLISPLHSQAPSLEERVSILRNGGATRQETVLNGLAAMRREQRWRMRDDDWVLVHDAARPGIDAELIGRLLEALHDDPVGGLLALPVVDTLKRADADGRVAETVSREKLWSAQTPQMFRYGVLRHALGSAEGVTDEAAAVEAVGLHPRLVEGHPRNFKITLPGDEVRAALFLSARAESQQKSQQNVPGIHAIAGSGEICK
jgi:2-C-methyl-D-erythritol 4-phosphate cytidylyltransferase